MSSTVCRNRSRATSISCAATWCRCPEGSSPGRIYQLAYRTTNPAVGGIGLAAFRDFAAWLKHGQQGSANAKWAYAFGSSQSGRFLRTFLYYGFNADEKGQQVFDGVMAHIAGAARLSINEPSATPNALSMYTATGFPFADAATRDPVSGKQEGLLDNDRARKHQPKVFYTNTAVEYWGGGRSAALIHTTPDGKSDLKVPDNVRIYFLTGAQHSPARFPARVTTGQQPENPVEYWWTLRALLMSMDRWVRQGTPPPASQHPEARRRHPRRRLSGRVSRHSRRRVATSDPGRPDRVRRHCRFSCRRWMRTATNAPASGRRRSACRSRPTPDGTSEARRSAGRSCWSR